MKYANARWGKYLTYNRRLELKIKKNRIAGKSVNEYCHMQTSGVIS